jgi:hypothetical protein
MKLETAIDLVRGKLSMKYNTTSKNYKKYKTYFLPFI